MAYRMQTDMTGITADSRQVTPGALFLAYPGESNDGRTYIADAIDKGARAVWWEPEGFAWHADWVVDNTPVANLKQEAGVIASQFYDAPSEKLWMLGVTGTNGKTSVTQWLAQCFGYLARKSAVIGTLGNGLLDALTPTVNTTPDALLLHQLLADYVQQEVETVAMEVSSHGLSQGRVNGVHFDVAVLTNLSRDHLDYHGSYENYALAKKALFQQDGLKHAVLNHDDAFGVVLAKELAGSQVDVLTYGIDGGDVRATDLRFAHGAIQFVVTTPAGEANVQLRLLGRFNVYNALAVLSVLLVSEVPLSDAIAAVTQIESLDGRMQQFGGGEQPLVVVDYAHTPDSLQNVLTALREETQRKLICVFGCGGDRDQGKRAMMGEVVSTLADTVVITSDNPRSEQPEAIVEDILTGVQGTYTVEHQRAKAIADAIANAQSGDVVLVAGKGHETYQERDGVKHYFSDVEQVAQALKQRQGASA